MYEAGYMHASLSHIALIKALANRMGPYLETPETRSSIVAYQTSGVGVWIDGGVSLLSPTALRCLITAFDGLGRTEGHSPVGADLMSPIAFFAPGRSSRAT